MNKMKWKKKYLLSKWSLGPGKVGLPAVVASEENQTCGASFHFCFLVENCNALPPPPPPSLQRYLLCFAWILLRRIEEDLDYDLKVHMKCLLNYWIWKSSKNQEDRYLPFLNISSGSRVINIKRWVVSDQKVPKKSCQNQSKSIKFVMWRTICQ